ncbi:MAG: multiple antibiotic resistance (MarC)-like protein [Ignavibacteriales bacterium UTCHB2]|nr:MAG: inner membrane protein [Ignavibacteria bacterium ADurb.Bin266]OQY74594.1 MAG: multiple antibiotic resistance (MarC)-like protein [Ignavibacteriales bacterium UTCHB2]HQI41401.1 MarC family protein [Ignavibacteriaceae bacterium]HQJ45246.1 MarC family protein [Ignavibacteriaceae bacterium]
MLAYSHSFIHMLFISVVALFPIINPIGSALIVNPYLSKLSDADKKAAVKKISLNAFSICVVTLFAGRWILQLFGISIPIIQLAGGIVICIMGWESLSTRGDNQNEEKDIENLTNSNQTKNINDKLFYPITFPITTGAGTISVLFTLSAHSSNADWLNYLINTAAMLLAIIAMCILVYFFYGNTKLIVSKLGVNGQTIANRFFAFLIFCVGLQIAVTGIKSLF